MNSDRRLNCFCTAAVVLVLSACASNKVSDQYRFQSVDTEDLSKRFTYGFSVRGPGGQERPSRDQRQSGPPRGGQTANFEEMREELENYMAITQYCIDGYFIYDETFNGSQYLLHGECQESKHDE